MNKYLLSLALAIGLVLAFLFPDVMLWWLKAAAILAGATIALAGAHFLLWPDPEDEVNPAGAAEWGFRRRDGKDIPGAKAPLATLTRADFPPGEDGYKEWVKHREWVKQNSVKPYSAWKQKQGTN